MSAETSCQAVTTLPDLLAPDLRLLSVGLNPSLPSVKAGFYFANPRNRFWKALNASRLLSSPIEPGVEAMQQLLEKERIGFTDLVKRPTRGAGDLRAKDYREGAPRLLDLIMKTGATVAWFHGKVAYGQFLRCQKMTQNNIDWGLQEQLIGSCRVFVTPNPSPANAVFSLQDLVQWYDRLADYTRSLQAAG